MCFVASFVATVQKVVSAIENPWFFGSQSQTALPGKHSSEALDPLLLVSPAVSFGVPGTPSSRFHLLSKFVWRTLAKSSGKKPFSIKFR